MKIFPFKKYEFTTLIPMEEVAKIISDNCERCSFGSLFARSKKVFCDSVEENKFKLYRAIKYQNSFLPILSGELKNKGGATTIVVIMRMPVFTNIFMVVWLSIALIAALGLVLKSDEPIFIVPLIMFLLGYGLMQGGFWYEVPKAKKLLNEIHKSSS